MALLTEDDMDTYGLPIERCIACSSRNIRLWGKKSFCYTKKEYDVEFSIYECVECGTGFLSPPPSDELLSEVYKYSGHALTAPIQLEDVIEQEEFFPNSSVDSRRISVLADELNNSGSNKAIDVGSGYGFYTKALGQLGYQVTAINPGEYENEVFRKLNSFEPFKGIFSEYTGKEENGVVVMSQVLEHIVNPGNALRKAHDLLLKGGVLAIAVPNFKSIVVRVLREKDNSCMWVPEHVNYFTQKGLTMLLESNGFKVVRAQQITKFRYDALSMRILGRRNVVLDALVKYVQIPVAYLVNHANAGIYINIYAKKINR